MSDNPPERTDTNTDTAQTPSASAPGPGSMSVSVSVSMPAPASAAVSVSQPPTPPSASPAAVIASLKNLTVAEVEASLVATREAYRRGEVEAIEAALIDQFAMLQTLGLKLLRLSGTTSSLPHIQVYANLGLRAVESSRKSLEALRRLIPPPPSRATP